MTIYTTNYPYEYSSGCGNCMWCRYGDGCRRWDPFHPTIWGSGQDPQITFPEQRYTSQVW